MSVHDPAFSHVNDAAVVVQNVGKDYVLKGASAGGGRPWWKRDGKRTVDALRNVNFVAKKGESIGIIGRNGSGKSTLLRIIAGGEAPTAGSVYVSHQPTLLGVAPALQGWLTGEQNAYLGLLALGVQPSEAKEAVPEVVKWAELGEAATRPMNTYSSGMGGKLSFAISTAVSPEILLVDEALSTGDAAFGAKAKRRMEKLLTNAGNIFLVSHALDVVKQNCERCIWIHRGDLVADGPVDDIVSKYSEFSELVRTGDKTSEKRYLNEVKENQVPMEIVLTAG